MTKSSSIRKFEKDVAKTLGEIAILIQLTAEKKGLHAYALFDEVEQTIFSKRKEASIRLEEVKNCINDLIEIYIQLEFGSTKFEQELTKLKEQIQSMPILAYNKHVYALTQEKDIGNIEQHVNYFKDILQKLEHIKEQIDERAAIWNNITGIYPILKNLEEHGLIYKSAEVKEKGRLRKLYSITDLGLNYLKAAGVSLIEVTSSMIPAIENILSSSRKSADSLLDFPLRTLFTSIIGDLRFDLLDPSELNLNQPKSVENSLFFQNFPSLSVLSEPFDLSKLIEFVFRQHKDPIERRILKQVITYHLQKRIKSFDKAMEKLNSME